MVVSIESAYLGDEKARANVTSSVRKKITDSGIEVPVNSSLLPIIQLEGDTSLNDSEIQEAREKAEAACGNASDSTCIELKSQEFKRQRMNEKENEQNSTANIIKGRRLTVTLNDDGKKKVLEIPEGQVFKLTKDELGSKKLETEDSSSIFNVTGTLGEILKMLVIIVGTGVYAFSILITYRSFIQAGYVWPTYIATAVAVFFPYSGFFIVLGFFGIRELIKNMPVTKQE